MNRLVKLTKIFLYTCIVFFAGICHRSGSENMNIYLSEKKLIEPYLAADPDFANVNIEFYNGGGIVLTGTVDNVDVQNKLKNLYIYCFGTIKSSGLLAVSVK